MARQVMAPSSLFVRLAVQHLGHRPIRTALLAFAVAVGGSAVFGAMALRQAIQEGLGASLDRLGADLMIVPRETTVNLSSALLTVETSRDRLDPATAAEISRLPGVEVAAPQQYFALPTAGDAHGDEDLIAFDPDRDFTVLPWLTEKLDRPFRRGDVIVGGRRAEAVGGEARLFGRTFPVYGRLGLTGVGPFERGVQRVGVKQHCQAADQAQLHVRLLGRGQDAVRLVRDLGQRCADVAHPSTRIARSTPPSPMSTRYPRRMP